MDTEKRLLMKFADELGIRAEKDLDSLELKVLDIAELIGEDNISEELRNFLKLRRRDYMAENEVKNEDYEEEEEDCFGRYYSDEAEECRQCVDAKECKRLTEQRMREKQKEEQAEKVLEKASKVKDKLVEKEIEKSKKKQKEVREKIKKEEAKIETVLKQRPANIKNPYEEGSGAYYVFEELLLGGTYEDLLERVTKKFQEHNVLSSPKARLDRLIMMAGKDKKLINFRAEKCKKDKELIIRLVSKYGNK